FNDGDPDGNGASDTLPIGGAWDSGHSEAAVVLAALGFNGSNSTQFTVKDGKVTMPAIDPLFREYLLYMNKLYSEGLVDPEIFIQNETAANAKSSHNKVGRMGGASPFVWAPDYQNDWPFLSPLPSQCNSAKIWPDGSSIQVVRF